MRWMLGSCGVVGVLAACGGSVEGVNLPDASGIAVGMTGDASGGISRQILAVGDKGWLDSAPFVSGRGGYAVYRAPTMVITPRGTILAFAEGRRDGVGDEGNIDVVLRRSTDGGRSWKAMQVLVDDGKNPCKNQSPVLLPGGRILLPYLWNPSIKDESERPTIRREMDLIYSDDDGETWSNGKGSKRGRNITAMTQRPEWGWTGLGPVHGIVKRQQPARGRVILSARHNTPDTNMVSHVIYSDDQGETWRIGGSARREKTTESTVVELSNGHLMLNSRNQRENESWRAVSISTDGGESFGSVTLDRTLIEPRGVQASLLFHSINWETGKANILFSNPAHDTLRTNGSVRISTDDGDTWDQAIRYAPGRMQFTGYSDMAVYGDGDIAVLYERGKADPDKNKDRYDEIGFTVIPRRECHALKSGGFTLTERRQCEVYAGLGLKPRTSMPALTYKECLAAGDRVASDIGRWQVIKEVRTFWGGQRIDDDSRGRAEVLWCQADGAQRREEFDNVTRAEAHRKGATTSDYAENRTVRWRSDRQFNGEWQTLRAGKSCTGR